MAVALVIAILAPYIGAENPDGLESTFDKITRSQDSQGSGDNELAAGAFSNTTEDTGNDSVFSSPFPDNSSGNRSKFGEATAIIRGIIIIPLLSFGLGKLLKRPKE